MSRISAGIYSPERSREVVTRLQQAAERDDRVIEIDRSALGSEQLVGERRLGSPDDVADWLHSFGFDRDICEFYADSVRAGQNLVVFEAQQEDEHFDRAAADMRAAEPPDVQRLLERWQAGERDIFPKDVTGVSAAGAAAGPVAVSHAIGEAPVTRPEEAPSAAAGEEAAAPVPPPEAVEEAGVPVEVAAPVEETPSEAPTEVPAEEAAAPVPPPEAVEEAGVPVRAVTGIETEPARESAAMETQTQAGVETASVAEPQAGAIPGEEIPSAGAEEETNVDESTFRSHFQQRYGDGTGSFDEFRDAYALGYGYGRQPRMAGMDYELAETTIKERYEQRHGAGSFERVRDAVRHGWNLGRG